MPAVHDRGGWPTDDPIDREEHEWADWERQTQSLRTVLDRKGFMNVDELRRGIESIDRASIETNLVEKGLLTSDEIDERAKALRDRWGYPS